MSDSVTLTPPQRDALGTDILARLLQAKSGPTKACWTALSFAVVTGAGQYFLGSREAIVDLILEVLKTTAAGVFCSFLLYILVETKAKKLAATGLAGLLNQLERLPFLLLVRGRWEEVIGAIVADLEGCKRHVAEASMKIAVESAPNGELLLRLRLDEEGTCLQPETGQRIEASSEDTERPWWLVEFHYISGNKHLSYYRRGEQKIGIHETRLRVSGDRLAFNLRLRAGSQFKRVFVYEKLFKGVILESQQFKYSVSKLTVEVTVGDELYEQYGPEPIKVRFPGFEKISPSDPSAQALPGGARSYHFNSAKALLPFQQIEYEFKNTKPYKPPEIGIDGDRGLQI
jgi:hypothetical protein